MAAVAKPRRKAAKGHKLPEPIPEGFIISDTTKKSWTIGKEIGSGGFGTVYYAAETKNSTAFNFVVKIEFHGNGPLFAEMHCCQKIGKSNQICDWIKKKKINYLGLSPCHGFGSFEYNGSKYRFMIIERYGKDLQKLFEESGKSFSVKTSYLIGISVLNILEYIHSSGYVHGDIKAANLLLGRNKGTEDNIYLVDMGLACKYTKDDVHKKNSPDVKRAHNGTLEFTSRDAHRGTFARRSDLEILGFNLLYWLTGKLPWENCKTPAQVQEQKERYMKDIPKLIRVQFPNENCPSGMKEFLEYVAELDFEEQPDYDYCRLLLETNLKKMGFSGPQLDVKAQKKTGREYNKPLEVSKKENIKDLTTSARTSKRKERAPIYIPPDVIPTPAMLAVVKKSESDGQKKKNRKKQ